MSGPTGREELAPKLDVPVFPLPKLVLFPGTLLPLHIFEPRYRQMFADCLAQRQLLIAVAQLKPGWEPLYEGRPPIYNVAGIGKITEHTRNADGTYDVLLEALSRARLDELDARGLHYRRATATMLHERLPKDGVDPRELAALFSLATRISQLVKRALPDFLLHASADDAPALLTDRIADQLLLDPAVRQDLLETVDVGSRVHELKKHLAQLHMALCSTQTDGTPTLH